MGIQFTVAIKAACEALKRKGYGDSRPYQIPNTDATILIGSNGNSGNSLLKLRFVQKRLSFVQLIEVKIKIKTEIKGLVLKCSVDLFLINNPTCVSDDNNFFLNGPVSPLVYQLPRVSLVSHFSVTTGLPATHSLFGLSFQCHNWSTSYPQSLWSLISVSSLVYQLPTVSLVSHFSVTAGLPATHSLFLFIPVSQLVYQLFMVSLFSHSLRNVSMKRLCLPLNTEEMDVSLKLIMLLTCQPLFSFHLSHSFLSFCMECSHE